MPDLKTPQSQDESEMCIHLDMPGLVGTEAELLAALALGDADIEAGRTLSFEDVAGLLSQGRAKD